MNDLNALVRDLRTLADSYYRRERANGPGHADNEYLNAQAGRFGGAARLIDAAMLAADRRAQAAQDTAAVAAWEAKYGPMFEAIAQVYVEDGCPLVP